jgi:acetolactate synthase-1/2/3 large subunit
MKLSNIVAQFLVEQGIGHAFVVSGGASLHLIHSIAETKGTAYVCPQHEQAGAMAADAYARVTGGMGCAVATSGPGATNLITGICSAYYDSVPVLFLTGNVATFRAKGDTGVRQVGFQETEMAEMCRSITKYSVLVKDPYRIRYELQKAVAIAKSGRPGPVLVDIPDDLQRMDIDPAKLVEYSPEADAAKQVSPDQIRACVEALRGSRRPVLVYGWGIHLSHAEAEARALVKTLGIPVALTWAALDLYPFSDPQAVGGFGTHGIRAANFTVQNADLILSVGSRLDTKATGSPASSFAREAKVIMVDIDPAEINKFKRFGRHIDLGISNDARAFLQALTKAAKDVRFPDLQSWRERVAQWKARYPAVDPKYAAQRDVNPYWFVKQLAAQLGEGEVIVSDTGCALAWMMQAFEFKERQRFFHAFNNTPMGYGLPAAIGACFARPGKRTILVSGDGSLQMSIHELATIARHRLPVKILMFNNQGHGMVRQTQDQWLGSHYYATSVEGGLAAPDFVAVARAHGIEADTLELNADIKAKLARALAADGPAFINIVVDPKSRVQPQVKFGRPNEDGEPLLERAEFLSNMLVKPLPASLEKN